MVHLDPSYVNTGSNFVEKLAEDLQNGLSGVEGFSRTNAFRTKAFFCAATVMLAPRRHKLGTSHPRQTSARRSPTN